MEYTGCVCNFKTYSKSYKLKKRIPNAKENMFFLPGTQETIVPQEQWNRVQEMRKNKRRITKGERQGTPLGITLVSSVLAQIFGASVVCVGRSLRTGKVIGVLC